MSTTLPIPTAPARARRFRRGNTLVETALVLPILLGLTFGSVEFGYFFFVKQTFQGAAREAAREAIRPGATNATVNARIAETLKAAGFQASATAVDAKFTVTLTPANVATAATNTSMTVKITCPWGTIGIRPMSLIPTTTSVSGTTVMRKEGPV